MRFFWHELGLHCSDFVFIYFSVRTASEIRIWMGNDIPIVLHENNYLSLNGPAGRRQLSITMFAVAVEYCRQRSNKCLWCSLLNQFPQGFFSLQFHQNMAQMLNISFISRQRSPQLELGHHLSPVMAKGFCGVLIFCHIGMAKLFRLDQGSIYFGLCYKSKVCDELFALMVTMNNLVSCCVNCYNFTSSRLIWNGSPLASLHPFL